MLLATAWQLQERGPDGEVGFGERLSLGPKQAPLQTLVEVLVGRLAGKSPFSCGGISFLTCKRRR